MLLSTFLTNKSDSIIYLMATPSPCKKVKLDTLGELKTISQIVADTGDFLEIQKYSPADSTTNPSLIIQSVQKP